MKELPRFFVCFVLFVAEARSQDSPHGALTFECRACHTTVSWKMKRDASFDHASVGFALTGQHQSVNCAACHPGLRFAPKTASCLSCHADVHRVPGEDLPKVMYRLMDAESYTHRHMLVVGGGDSAVEAAVGLARQRGNTVVLSYRRKDFVRIKEKNEQRVREYMSSGMVRVIFKSKVLEIGSRSVLIHEGGNILHNVPNDFVFIFAGGEMPTGLLTKAGVRLRTGEVEVVMAA